MSSLSQAYLDLAHRLLYKEILPGSLAAEIVQLPRFTEAILRELVGGSDLFGLFEPYRNLAIMQVAAEAARCQDCEPLLVSQADWYLGYAYNCCVQPQKSRPVLLRARRVFRSLGQIGWIAACNWQLHAIPWTCPDFLRTPRILEQALAILESAGFETFAPRCRLALADSQLLVGDFDAALKNIEVSEQRFSDLDDPLDQALCWVSKASMYRRQAKFDDALSSLQKALKVFAGHDAWMEIAKTQCQLGLCYFLSARNYQKAERYFEQAFNAFFKQRNELLCALCLTYWGQVSLVNGNLHVAASQLRRARDPLLKYKLQGLAADNFNDSGQLELIRGNIILGIDHFKNAESIYRRSGILLAAAIALANLGNAFAFAGRYQDALYYLELAESEFQALNNPSRLAGCEMYLSKIMTELNQYKMAHQYLDRAEELFSQVKQVALLAQVHAQRAKLFSLENRHDEVISSLNRALEIANQYGAAPQAALAERQLGEALSAAGYPSEAFEMISGAEKKFRNMGMVMEQAATLTALGVHFVKEKAASEAQNAFKQALEICRYVMPELEEDIFAGLAILAESNGDLELALEYYREALRAGVKLRSGFWQPGLAGLYLQRSVHISAEAVGLAARLGEHDDMLAFIEGNKAQALIKQLGFSSPYSLSDLPLDVENLHLEIQILQRRLRVTYDSGPMGQLSDLKKIQRRLIECAQEYDRKLQQIERKNVIDLSSKAVSSPFNVGNFFDFANKSFGESWIAVDYYLTASALFAVFLTPNGSKSWLSNISAQERIAIDACKDAWPGRQLPSRHQLNLLGNLLICDAMKEHLSADTFLVIAPHGDLHGIPWAALRPDLPGHKALVEMSIPIVVPSLQVFQIIGERAAQKAKPDRYTGLLVGLANFEESRQPLPHVDREIQALYEKADQGSVVLLNAHASRDALKELLDGAPSSSTGLSRFSFFHIASHVVHDSRTGRLTSIALYNDEIWVDQLRDFAPLPNLVTLSACNGTQSLMFGGDEPVGLASTCLIAGADAVVGSLWPVLDSTTTDLMIDFYDAYFVGLSPAVALAQAQRKTLLKNESLDNWASFIFIGVP